MWMWEKLRSLVQLARGICCPCSPVDDPVTIRFFLAHATRIFGPHEIVHDEPYQQFQLLQEELNLASIQREIVQFASSEFPGRFLVYSELRIFQVTAEDGVSQPERFTERLCRGDASLLTATSQIQYQSNVVDIAAVYVDNTVPLIPPGVNLAQREREHNIARAREASAPSGLSKDLRTAISRHYVGIGRPLDVTAPDPSIFSPPMAYLSQALNEPPPNADGDTLDTVTQLFSLSSATYKNELARSVAICPILKKLFDVDFVPEFEVFFGEHGEEYRSAPPGGKRRRGALHGARADGVVFTIIREGVRACRVILEFKNELGMAGAGDFQVAATHMKFMVHPIFAFISERTPCPTILFGLSGTGMYIAYAILADAFTATPIGQHWFPLGGATRAQRRTNIFNFARIVPAVRNAIERLQTFYMGLHSTPTSTYPPPYLPNPTPVDPSTSRINKLKFVDKLSRDPSQSLFRATFGDRDVIVKFSDGYGGDAHKRLAKNQLAPQLLHTEGLVGGLTMVVMAFHPDMTTSYDKYFGGGLPGSVIKEVDRALNLLRTKGVEGPLVHGDLSRANILVPRDANQHTPVHIVGFRWSGKAGDARYPCDVFLDESRGPAIGRKGNQQITHEHDRQMRDSLLTAYT